MTPRALVPGLLALIAACDDRFVAVEEWATPPAIRIAVVVSQGEAQVRLLGASEALEASLAEAFDAGGSVSVWLLSYSLDQLTEHSPALNGRSLEEVTRLLIPELVSTSLGEAPEAQEVLCTTVGPATPRQVMYRRCSWQEWKQQGLRVGWTLPPSEACAATVTSFELPAGLSIQGMVATGPEEAVLIVARGALDRPLGFMKLSSGALTPMAPLGFFGPLPDVLSFDPQRRRILGVAKTSTAGPRRPFSLSETGVEDLLPDLDDAWSTLSAGADGTVLGAAFDLVQLEAGAWKVLEDRHSEERPVWLLRTVRRDRVFFFTSCWVHRYSVDEGQQDDNLLFFDHGCVNRPGGLAVPVSLTALAADEDLLVGAFADGRVATVSGRTVDWLFAGSGLLAAAPLGGSRFLVAGRSGLASYRIGPAWCPLLEGSTIDLALASSAGDGATAYIAGAQPGSGRAMLFRVSVPPLRP